MLLPDMLDVSVLKAKPFAVINYNFKRFIFEVPQRMSLSTIYIYIGLGN